LGGGGGQAGGLVQQVVAGGVAGQRGFGRRGLNRHQAHIRQPQAHAGKVAGGIQAHLGGHAGGAIIAHLAFHLEISAAAVRRRDRDLNFSQDFVVCQRGGE